MTENEAIKIIRERHKDCEDYRLQFDSYPDGYDFELDQAILMAAQALEEIQQYREIGTVEEIKDLLATVSEAAEDVDESGISVGFIKDLIQLGEYRKIGTVEECRDAREKISSLEAYIENIKWERDVAAQQLEEIGVSIGAKMDAVIEAMEKQKPNKPVWKNGKSIMCKDYADGHGKVEEAKWADWVCPNCGWFVGEQYIPRRRNQKKCNYCSRCGQAIYWDK